MRSQSIWFFIAPVIIALLLTAYVVGGAFSRAAQAEIPEDVVAGFDIWRENSCESCHTLYGQGGQYAPDLTHIVALRGDEYIREFVANPPAFHPNQRIMPRLTLTQIETQNLLAFLNWVDSDEVAADDWPPRAIQIAGSGRTSSTTIINDNADPTLTLGRTIFSQRCASCHSLSPNVVIVGPSLAGLPSRAGERVAGQSAQAYMRNSILNPSDYVVAGFPDVMQKNFAEVVSSRELDALLEYLLTLEG